MLVSAILYWPTPELAFVSDNSPVSWLSSAQLWAIAVLTVRLGADRSLPAGLALWLAIAIVALAFDEQFMFHEHWKYGCAKWVSACRHYGWVTELPIIMVGLVGVVTVARLHRALHVRSAKMLVWSAYVVGLLAISIDLFSWPRPLIRYEEGLEVFAEALFVGGLLVTRGRDNLQRAS